MLVKDAMSRGAETITADATLQEAARRMRERGIGSLPVAEGDRLIGMITDRDIVVRATADGLDPMQTAVRAAMTPQIVYCLDQDPLHVAARLMEERSIRRVIVLNAQHRLVGMLSADDLALVARGLAADVLERSRDPERPVRPAPWRPAT